MKIFLLVAAVVVCALPLVSAQTVTTLFDNYTNISHEGDGSAFINGENLVMSPSIDPLDFSIGLAPENCEGSMQSYWTSNTITGISSSEARFGSSSCSFDSSQSLVYGNSSHAGVVSTLDLWYYDPDASDGSEDFFMYNFDPTGGNDGCYIRRESSVSTTQYTWLEFPGGTSGAFSPSALFETGWHNFRITMDGNQNRCTWYIDGLLRKNFSDAAFTTQGVFKPVGSQTLSNTAYIDRAMIYNGHEYPSEFNSSFTSINLLPDAITENVTLACDDNGKGSYTVSLFDNTSQNLTSIACGSTVNYPLGEPFNYMGFIYQVDMVNDSTGNPVIHSLNFTINESSALKSPQVGYQLSIDLKNNFTQQGVPNYNFTVYNATNTSFVVVFGGVGTIRLSDGDYTINITGIANSTYYDINLTNATLPTFDTTVNLFANQTTVNFTAFERFSKNPVNLWNASSQYGGHGNSIANFLQLHPSANDTVNWKFNGSGYDQIAFKTNFTPLYRGNYSFNFTDMLLNFSIMETPVNVTYNGVFSFNVTDIVTGEVINGLATGGVTNISLISGRDYNIAANASGLDVMTRNFTLSASRENVTLFAQSSNSLNFEIYNEETHALLIKNASIEVIGTTSANFSTQNGTLFIEGLLGGDYEIRYSSTGFDKRSYFVSIPTGGSEDVDLFLLNSTLSTLVVFKIVDENNNPLVNHLLWVQRLYPSLNVFETVEMSRSDFNGEAVTHIVTNSQQYRFLVTSSDFTPLFNSQQEVIITSQTPQIRVQVNANPLGFVSGLNEVFATDVSYNAASSIFSYTFVDGQNYVDTACLEITRLNALATETINKTCTTSNSGTISVGFDPNVNGEYTGSAMVNVSTGQQYTASTNTVLINDARSNFGTLGVFLALLLIVGFAVLFRFSIAIGAMMSAGALVASAAFGFYAVSTASIIGLFIGGLIWMFVDKGGNN